MVLRTTGRRQGFTLVELLVVLAILVILFGLLFAPMMTSLDMAEKGQSRARLQDTARYAMELIRRTVGNGVYVLPTEIVRPTAAPNMAYANLSTLMVAQPRRGTAGVLLSPLQPAVRAHPTTGVNYLEVVRFTVHPKSGRIVRYDDDAATQGVYPPGTTKSTAQPSSGMIYEPSLEDPFVLFQQTGVWYLDPAVSAYRFGSFDATGAFIPNEPISENALTLGKGYDVQCTGSVCDSCGARNPGFRRYDMACPVCNTAAGYTYLFDGVRFVPQRVAGEELQKRTDGTVYTARRAGWTGYSHSAPTTPCPQLSRRSLDPRIVVYRYDPATGTHSNLQYDSYSAPPTDRGTPTLNVAWDGEAGGVKFGRFFLQTVTLTESGGGVSAAIADDEATVTPLDALGSPTAPTGYRVEPSPEAIILPSTVKVRVIANLTGGGTRWVDLVQTDQYEQHQIGPWQFAVRRSAPPANWAPWIPDDWATNMDILFNDFPVTGPPGVGKFAALGMAVDSVEVRIQYWARRNADLFTGASATGLDDVVRVDYNTRNVLDVNLTVSEYVDYEEDAGGNLTIPAPPPITQQASLHDTVTVRNAGR